MKTIRFARNEINFSRNSQEYGIIFIVEKWAGILKKDTRDNLI